MTYYKLRQCVPAIQWDETNTSEISLLNPEGTIEEHESPSEGKWLWIKNSEGNIILEVFPGDVVIKLPSGELINILGEEFEENYIEAKKDFSEGELCTLNDALGDRIELLDLRYPKTPFYLNESKEATKLRERIDSMIKNKNNNNP